MTVILLSYCVLSKMQEILVRNIQEQEYISCSHLKWHLITFIKRSTTNRYIYLVYVADPDCNTLKTLQICDVIYENKALCTTEIAGTKCMEPFLASSIPGGNCNKSYTHEQTKKRRSNCRIPKKDYFKEYCPNFKLCTLPQKEQEKTHMKENLGARYSNKRNTLEIYSE